VIRVIEYRFIYKVAEAEGFRVTFDRFIPNEDLFTMKIIDSRINRVCGACVIALL